MGFGKMHLLYAEISGAGRYAPWTLLWSDFLRVTHMAGKPLKNSRVLHLKITSKWTKHIIFSEFWVPKPLILQGVSHKKIPLVGKFRSVPPKAREVGEKLVKLHPFVNMLDKPIGSMGLVYLHTFGWFLFFCRWIYHTWILSLEEFRHHSQITYFSFQCVGFSKITNPTMHTNKIHASQPTTSMHFVARNFRLEAVWQAVASSKPLPWKTLVSFHCLIWV